MAKITIVNAHWSNRGDEAALRPIINKLLDEKSNEVTIIFKDREEISEFPYSEVKHVSTHFLPKDINVILDCIHEKENTQIENGLKKTVDLLRKTELIIYSPGGAVISNSFWWIKQLEYLTPFICAKEFKIPIVVAAPSMGPFNQELWKNKILKNYLNCADKIIVRETISNHYLSKIGVDSEVTIDTAFYDAIAESSVFTIDKELGEFFEKHNKVVAMTLSDFAWNVPLKEKKELLAKNEDTIEAFIDQLIKQGYGILLIPQLFGSQDDATYLTRYYRKGVFILSNTYDTYIQQYIVSRCFALIGMRYHSNIFAAKAGVPFIAIGYEDKMFGFMQQWELIDYLLYIDHLSLDILCSKWNQLVCNHERYKYKLKKLRKIWQKKAQITVDAILNYDKGEKGK